MGATLPGSPKQFCVSLGVHPLIAATDGETGVMMSCSEDSSVEKRAVEAIVLGEGATKAEVATMAEERRVNFIMIEVCVVLGCINIVQCWFMRRR